MALPNPDPSLPSSPTPFFSDNSPLRADHARINNEAIWGNFDYLEGRANDLDAEIVDTNSNVSILDDQVSALQENAGALLSAYIWDSIPSIGNNAWTGLASVIDGSGNSVVVAVGGTGITGHIIRSLDDGSTWGSIQNVSGLLYEVAQNGGVLIASMQSVSNTVYRSTDYGATWTAITFSGGGNVFKFVKASTTGVYIFSTTGAVYRSVDNGLTWSSYGTVGISPTSVAVVYDQSVIIIGSATFAACAGNTIRVSGDGATWNTVTNPSGGPFTFVAIEFSPARNIIVIDSTNLFAVRFSIATNLWSAAKISANVGTLPTRVVWHNGVYVVLGKAIQIGGGGYGPPIFRSIDYGQTWYPTALPFGGNNIFAAGDTVFGRLIAIDINGFGARTV